jgi:hypothetical protein
VKAAALAVLLGLAPYAGAQVVTVTTPVDSCSGASCAKYGVGSTQRIRWTHDLGTAETFTVEMSRDGGSNYTTVATGVLASTATAGNYLYVVAPCTVSCPETSAVRVTAEGGSGASDVSATFPTVDLTPPVWKQPNVNTVTIPTGVNKQLVWTHVTGYQGSGYLFTVTLARDGTNFTEAVGTVTAGWQTRAELPWTPTGTCDTPGACRLRVVDYLGQVSDSAPFDLQ